MYIKFNNARPIIESNCGLIKRRFQGRIEKISVNCTDKEYLFRAGLTKSNNLFSHTPNTLYRHCDINSVELDEN